MKDLFSLFPQNDFSLLAIVLLMPLLGAFINGVFGQRLGKSAVRLMALTAIGVSFVAAVVTFVALNGAVDATRVVTEGHGPTRHEHVKLFWHAWEWMQTSRSIPSDGGIVDARIPIDFTFSVDALSGVMMLVITGVGFLIHVYSAAYMAEDKGFWRFFTYLNLFIFSMLVLVLGDNLVVLFVGWEGVGLCSYLLIGFWYEHLPNSAAGKKAFIANRIGDFGLICAMFLLVHYTGALDWNGIAAHAHDLLTPGKGAQVHLWPIGGNQFQDLSLFGLKIPLSYLQPDVPWTITAATAVGLALFLGCTGKSAQIPLYVWLPDAMAGPTPVSALIHAATMVTAGVYLICRLSFVFVLSPAVMTVIAVTGAFTALFAATIALVQNDIKKVLAYSTVSQLGYMFAAMGVGAYSAGMFHVTTHAFFKALLFLGAGSVIHALGGEQDIRRMGGLKNSTKTTYITFLVATLAIAGIPPLSGFFSKDSILANAFQDSPAAWTLLVLAALLTAVYMFRLLFLTFFGSYRGQAVPHESPKVMTMPLVVLAVLSVVGGVLNIPHVFGGNEWLKGFLSPAVDGVLNEHLTLSAATEFTLMAITLVLTLLGIWFAWNQYGKQAKLDGALEDMPWPKRLVARKWMLDELYAYLVERPYGWFSRQFFNIGENKVAVPLTAGTGDAAHGFAEWLRKVHTGNTSFYIFGMMAGVVIFLLITLFGA